jgi:glycosyltransferase involved in cell wall biosynthesis
LPGSVFERLDVARWKDYQASVWERFDCIQVLTPRDAAALRGLQPCTAERVRVNPFSVTLPETADQEDEEEGHVVFAGGFSHPPNVDAARWLSLDILPRLRARGIRSKLTLVGSEPPKEVRSLANGDVFVTGRVPEVEPYLRRAAVVAAPMRSGGGQRMKVLQGMAHGKPVVTTPLGAEGLEIGGASPPLMIGRDSDELADALANLLTSARRRRELGLAARSFVLEHFSPQAYAGRLEAVYQDAIRLHASRNGKSVAG